MESICNSWYGNIFPGVGGNNSDAGYYQLQLVSFSWNILDKDMCIYWWYRHVTLPCVINVDGILGGLSSNQLTLWLAISIVLPKGCLTGSTSVFKYCTSGVLRYLQGRLAGGNKYRSILVNLLNVLFVLQYLLTLYALNHTSFYP